MFDFRVHPVLLFFPKTIAQVIVAKDYTSTTFDEKKTGSDEATLKMQLSQENNNCFFGVVLLLSEERKGRAWPERKSGAAPESSRSRRNIVPKGKLWSYDQEKRLREMVSEGANIVNMATAFNCKPDVIRKKLDRLGLKVVVQKLQKTRTTTSTLLPKDIIMHEQALRTLAGALEALTQWGLDELELQRLRILVDTVQTYDCVLEKFEGVGRD